MQAALVRRLGNVPYEATLERMRMFTEQRDAGTADEIWLLEHPPVFTLGTNADATHVLAAGDIPVVPVDRGGEVTYHGPGQLVVYVLLDIRRLRLGVRDLVCKLEQSVIALLAGYGVTATGREGAPGVYVDEAKVASIGLRIRRNCSYHGLALNIEPDLAHFDRINPCGYPGLSVTSLRKLGVTDDPAEVADKLLAELSERLNLPVQDAA